LVASQFGIDDHISASGNFHTTQRHAGQWRSICQGDGDVVGAATQGGLDFVAILEAGDCQVTIDVNIDGQSFGEA